MNKKIIVALVALASIFSFSQEGVKAMKFSGVRAGINMNSFTTGDMGMGFGVGGIASIPITDIIVFTPEAAFLYRTLASYSEGDKEESISEFAISIPLLFQIAPIAGTPVHFAGGLQIDIPFSSEMVEKEDGKTEKETIEKRSTLNFGIALGAGYRVMPNIGVDFRAVIGLTALTSESGDDTSLNQYGLGVSYFF